MRIMGSVEDHKFYHCIHGLLFVQKLAGGPIQRQKTEHKGKAKYYMLKIYCIVCNLITLGALVRAFLIFEGGFSVKTENLFAYLIISLYTVSGATQIASFFSYQEILPFLDTLISTVPQRINQKLHRSNVVIHCMVAFGVSFLLGITANSYYFILQPDPDPVYVRLAAPWTDTLTEARISFMVTFACFLPAVISWTCCGPFFLTGAYYLRAGFIDLHKAMERDPQMVTNFSTYKEMHLCLSELTARLDHILRGYIGSSLIMATFDMCFLIFTLGDTKSILVLLGSISILFLALVTLLAIALLSISINSWVTIILSSTHDIVENRCSTFTWP